MNIFAFVKSQVIIFDVVSQYITLKKAGHYYRTHCPFHSEKTASFTVSPLRGIFYCFGCQAGGDAITFIEKIENCSALEAVQILANRFGLQLPEETEQYQQKKDKKQHYYGLCSLIANWSHQQLQLNPSVRQYVKNRNIAKESIEQFQIGYFPGGLQSVQRLCKYIQKNNFLTQDLLDANILLRSKNILYSPFENRIIFPIKDHLGNHCGFGGRVFKKDDTRAKYYNSRENEFFTKGSLLFGLDIAKKEIQQKESVFLVEGYTDCIAMAQHGLKNTVATLGTASSIKHLQQLARFASTVYTVYDQDKAGIAATLRLAQLCWQADLDLRVITLPKKEDPASFLQKDNDFTPLIEKSEDIFSYYIKTMGEDFASKPLARKLKAAQDMLNLICHIDHRLKRDLLLQQAAAVLIIPLATLKQELKALLDKKPKKERPPENTMAKKPEMALQGGNLEKKIFFAILNNTQLFTSKNEFIVLSCLPKAYGPILRVIKQEKEKDPQRDFMLLYDQFNEEQKSIIHQSAFLYEQPVNEDEFIQLIAQLHKKYWKQLARTIKLQMQHAKEHGDIKKMQDLLNTFLRLKKNFIQNKGTFSQ